MRHISLALVVAVLTLSPLVAVATPGGNGHGHAYGLAKHGDAPLPVLGAGLPGLAAAGVIYLVGRRKRTDKE